jgi:transcriptional regulator
LDYKLLGKNIKEVRKSLKMTQEQLAEKIEVSTVFISQIESGSRKPSLETIYKLSIALKIKIDTLINTDYNTKLPDDVTQLVDLLNMCSPKQRAFVTEISKDLIFKLMEDKTIE